MPNHVHLLMRFHLHTAFKSTSTINFSCTQKYFARANQHVGHVFQDRFKSIPVADNLYLLECGRYIERNPVKAGITPFAEKYEWSSSAFYMSDKPNELVTVNPLFKDLGEMTRNGKGSIALFLLKKDRMIQSFIKQSLEDLRCQR